MTAHEKAKVMSHKAIGLARPQMSAGEAAELAMCAAAAPKAARR